MSKNRNIADLLNSNGDVKPTALDGADTPMGRRNLIINGGFDVWQRSTDATGIFGYIAPDRWALTYSTNASNIRLYRQSSNDDVMDSTYHLGISSNGATIASNAYQRIETRFEKNYGLTSGGSFRPVTVSFWARSPQSNYVMVYAGNSSDAMFFTGSSTWTKYTHTFNASNVDRLSFYFAYDRAEIVDLEISQVQLELGSVATPFEHRSYGEELALCQRYYQKLPEPKFAGVETTAYTARRMSLNFPTEMRASPSFSIVGTLSFYNGQTTGSIINSDISQAWVTPRSCDFDTVKPAQGGTAQGNACITYIPTSGVVNGYAVFDAEL